MIKHHQLSSLLFVVLILSLLVIPGCLEPAPSTSPDVKTTTPAPLTTNASVVSNLPAPGQQELKQVLADSLTAMAKINTYTFYIYMDTQTEVTGGTSSGKVHLTSTMIGTSDRIARQMAMNTNAYLNTESPSGDISSQNVSMDMYLLGDILYLQVEFPPFGKQWMKTPVSEELKDAYNLNMVDRQIAPLETVKDINFLRYEILDGSVCYVLTMTPDMEKIMAWVNKNLSTSVDPEQISRMFKNISYTIWISKDSGLLKNMNVKMRLEMNSSQFASGENPGFNNMNMDISLMMKLLDFDKPVSITLPAEAKNALEIPLTIGK